MLEKDFNSSLRSSLRLQGLGAIHLVETDEPGPADLMVFEKGSQARIIAWLELKIDDEPLRPSQIEFMRKRDREAGNAYVVRQDSGTGLISVERAKTPDAWNVSNSSLIVVHRTVSIGFDWAYWLARWKRSRK